jgi:hypothetical protein
VVQRERGQRERASDQGGVRPRYRNLREGRWRVERGEGGGGRGIPAGEETVMILP